MNIVAIDIGNTNITVGLFLDGMEDSVQSLPGADRAELTNALQAAWQKIPVLEASAEGRRDGVIVVSSVKPAWTESVRQLAQEELHEKIILIGDEVTGDLDSESGLAIMGLLADLNAEGMTIVYVTHDPRMAEFARRLIHMVDGKLLNGDGAAPGH